MNKEPTIPSLILLVEQIRTTGYQGIANSVVIFMIVKYGFWRETAIFGCL